MFLSVLIGNTKGVDKMNIFKEAISESPRATKKSIVLGATLLVVLMAAEIYATYLIPEWRKYFYNILELRDKAALPSAIHYFIGLMLALIVTQSLKQYIGRTTALHVRTSLTTHLLKLWGNTKVQVDNPAQRINQDCQIATDNAIKVWIEVIISASLVIMLIFQSRHDTLIVWTAIGYTLIISAVAALFKKPLISTEIALQRAEADHRETLITMASDPISAYSKVRHSVKKYLNTMLGYTIFSASQNQFSILVPWAILSIPYFNGQIKLGDFMGGVAIFELIVVNSTILVSLFPDVTKAQASWIRVTEFNKLLKG